MKRIASKSHHNKYCHSVIILKGDRVLSYGHNHSHVHAEITAIRRLLRRNKRGSQQSIPNNLHLISYMFKRHNGNEGNSKPCENCEFTIRELGLIKTITYFQENKPWQLILRK